MSTTCNTVNCIKKCLFFFFFRKLPTSTTYMAAEEIVKTSDSAVTQVASPKTFWNVGRAEMKQQAKKESIKQQKKRRKRKAEGKENS